ncbi:MAG: beta-lactamase family protein [Clostridiales bacterium]|nr:beta-lactamase family protein [Clostridiales bacterium]
MEMKFTEVTEFLDQVNERYGVPACECILYQNHRQIYRHTAGHLDWEGTAPLAGGEWYWIYSCTKLMTMTAVMQLRERGLLELDDPVAKYLPELSAPLVREADGTLRPARTVMTLRHLMTMTGGFTYDQTLESLVRQREESHNQATTRQMIAALAREPLAFDPGTHFCYSMCHDVMGAVIEVVSGERFSDYVSRHIAAPLGITGLTFHPDGEKLDHMPDQLFYVPEEDKMIRFPKDNSHQLTEPYDSGGAGICCRAEDYILFLDALACGGVGANGARILTPESVALLHVNQLQGTTLDDFHNTMKPSPAEGYGLGMRVHLSDDGGVPAGEFGWDGAAGALASMEPSGKLSIFYVQHVLNYLPNYADLHPELLRRIYESVGE